MIRVPMQRSIFLCALICSFGILAGIQEKFPQKDLHESVTFQFNEGVPSFRAETLSLISFGYPHLLSNLLWLRFLQATPVKKVPKGETSWIYYDLNSILDLDPYFYPAATEGGVFLSIVTEDKEGARLLLEKGTTLFPNNWRIRAYLGYHYDWELGDRVKAKENYLIGSRLPGAPYILGLIAARYLSQQNSMAEGIAILDELLKMTKDPVAKKKFLEKKIALEHGKQR